MLILFSISFVSASPNDTTTSDANNVLTSNEDKIQIESNDVKLQSIKKDILNNDNKNKELSDNNGLLSNQSIDKKTNNIKKDNDEITYKQLINEIELTDFGDTLVLNHNVRHNGDSDAPHISITKSIIIDGQNHYISGNNEKGIFRFDDTDGGITLTLENLILKNAISDNGGVIHTKKNVKINIINCTFIDNEAIEDGGAIYFDSTGELYISDSTFERCKTRITDSGYSNHNGGAINTQDGTLTIDNCTFTNNTAGFGYGGAIYLHGECRGITDSVFKYNTARSRFGGAIYVDSSNKNGIVIDNSIFMNNTSLALDRKHGSGGAVYYEGKGVVKLTNSNFTGNLVLGSPTWNKNEYEASRSTYISKGGAVSSDHDIWIGNCSFMKNHAVDRGGAVNSEEGIWWLDENSVFISNTVGHSNVHLANKGGAVYASKFLNDAKGLIFIDNHGWYGGAIYINNKNELTFESCVFINNSVWNNDGKNSPGAAIYIDSSSSKLTLINNIFYRNSATYDSGVYNCGSYGTIKNNWYGYNDVNFEKDAYLVEWHRIGSNDKRVDSNSLRITLSANQTEVFHSSVKLSLKFVCSDQTEFTGKLTNWTVDFTSNNKGVFSDLQIGDNEATVIFTPEPGNHVVTAKVHGQEVSVNINQMGDFTWLQQQIYATPSGGVLNINRNLTYAYEVDRVAGIDIHKPITINGNGYTINGLKFAKLFNVHSSDVTFENLKFIGGRGIMYESGAISTDEGTNNLQVINCTFIDNMASDNGGGAILLYSPNSKIINSSFFDNEADQGGAIDIRLANVTIDGCEFINNTATTEVVNGGGAINNFAENVTISNSVFLNNKAMADHLYAVVANNTIIMTLTGMQNYINAIYSSQNIKFNNVTYWDGEVTTSSNPVYSENESGQNITLDIYNSDNQIVKHVNLVTDNNGQAVYNYSALDSGNYTFKAIHYEDSYYASYVIDEGSFNYTRDLHFPSEVKINIPDGKEFYYGDCNISFNVTNGTEVEVYITNANSEVFYDNITDLNYINVNLPASDEEYVIYVYNWGNETYNPSSDYKKFKILKINSTVSADPVLNVNYGQNVSVSFAGDGTSYNVTIYNSNNEIVFSKITNETSLNISNLDAGEYNVTIINLGNENMAQSISSTRFTVEKIANNFEVKVDNGTYGHDIAITVTADVDGDYNVDVNSRIITVYVEDGKATEVIDDFGAGNYTANVSFANDNYINNATNCTFTIQKGQSRVGIVGLDENVSMNQNTSIRFTDFYPAKYNVTIYDSNNQIVKSEISDSLLYSVLLPNVGTYNLTVTNLGDDNVTGSTASVVFNVNTENYVEVIVEDTEYGKELYIGITANVDGYYTVNLNGTEITIEVVDGIGEFYDLIDINAGDYTTDVIFDNPDYINIINNTNFTIYPVESNIKIYEIGNVSYGEDIYVRFYENYPTVFYIEVRDSNDTVVMNTTFEYEDQDPEMSVILSGLDAGNYRVIIENLGDDENIYANSSFADFNVTKATPTINVTAKNVTYPEDVIINVTASLSGNYTVQVGNNTQITYIEENTTTPVIFEGIDVGEYNVTVSIDETNNYVAATNTTTVTVQDLKLTVDPIITKVGDIINITARITAGEDTLTDINKGKVVFKVNGKIVKDTNGKVIYAKVVNGQASIENYIVPQNWAKEGTTIQAVYSGSTQCEKLTSEKTNITIAKSVPTLTTEDVTAAAGSIITLKATISDNDNVINTGKIVFKINGKTVKDENGKVIYAKVVNNIVEFEYALPESYKAGSYNITATFISPDYDRLTDSKILTVN